jgi:hypothetical protein
MFSAVGLALLSGLAAYGQAPANAWALGHSDAKVLVGLDLKTLRESSAGKLLTSQIGSQLPQQAGPFAMALPLILQALNDVDRISISSPATAPGGKTGATSGATSVDARNSPFLVVMEGRFGPGSPLGFFMTGKPTAYQGVNLYQPMGAPAASDMNLALLNENTLLVGDGKSMRGAIDHQGQASGGIPAALRARAAEMANGHDLWIVMHDAFAGQSAFKTAPGGPAAEIEGLEMGVGLHDGMQFDVNLAARSEATAGMLGQMLLMQVQSTIESSQLDNPMAADLARRLQINAEGKVLHVSLRMTQDELQQQIRAVQTQRSLAQASPRTQR